MMRRALLLATAIALSVPALADEPVTIVVRAPAIDPALLLNLIERAKLSMDNNDVTAARLLLVPAVRAGDSGAIRMYAQTLDPTWLLSHAPLGANFADPERASTLYKYAADLGDPAAMARWADLSSVDEVDGCKKVVEVKR